MKSLASSVQKIGISQNEKTSSFVETQPAQMFNVHLLLNCDDGKIGYFTKTCIMQYFEFRRLEGFFSTKMSIDTPLLQNSSNKLFGVYRCREQRGREKKRHTGTAIENSISTKSLRHYSAPVIRIAKSDIMLSGRLSACAPVL